MKRKIIAFLASVIMVITPLTAYAKGFSGGSRNHSSYQSHSSSSFNSQTNGSTYHSGYKSPSSNVTSQTRQNTGQGVKPASKTHGFLTHAAAFGAGALLGSMFHPFGGGNGQAGFSLIGFLLDILVIGLIIWVVRKLFFKRA
jgi:hypothetical protein